jgi:hypothetical protein
MEKLARSKLWSLEQYAVERTEFKKQVIEHKQARQLSLGPNATLYFEDFTTMKYQVQEMLRVERIFEAKAIEDEIDAYNPLIPDGSNWKATFMIEYPDVEERRTALGALRGVEHKVWCRVGNLDPVFAIANEDMERSSDEKTAAVHFLRFELTHEAVTALRENAELIFGIDHEALSCETEVGLQTRQSLLDDLDS